jgi:hypothetical protein
MQNLVREVSLRGMKEVLDLYLLLKMFLREMEEHVFVGPDGDGTDPCGGAGT